MKKILTILFIGLLTAMVNADSTTIVSDTTVEYQYWTGGSWTPAAATWVHPSWPSISGATWIWTDYLVDSESEFGPVTFNKTFMLPVNAIPTNGSIQITADNAYELYINGVYIGADGTVSSPTPTHADDPSHEARWSSIETYSFTPTSGVNEIRVEAANYRNPVNPESNPAGVIYKAVVEYYIPTTTTMPSTTTTIPATTTTTTLGPTPVPEFTSLGSVLAILLAAPAFAYLLALRRH